MNKKLTLEIYCNREISSMDIKPICIVQTFKVILLFMSCIIQSIFLLIDKSFKNKYFSIAL